jgi:hypothetical protein
MTGALAPKVDDEEKEEMVVGEEEEEDIENEAVVITFSACLRR